MPIGKQSAQILEHESQESGCIFSSAITLIWLNSKRLLSHAIQFQLSNLLSEIWFWFLNQIGNYIE